MKRSNKKVPVSTVLLFVAALVLLSFTAVQGARAALNILSDQYDAEMATLKIGVEIVDSEGTVVSGDDGITLPAEEDGTVKVGKTYPLELYVQNPADEDEIDEYVRVSVYKYWVDDSGEKDPSLDPELIKLGFSSGDWMEDTSLRTKERSVFYYKKVLASGEKSAIPFLKTITLDSDVSKYVHLKETTETIDDENYTVITTTYDFNGKSYKVDVQADAVQTHNAKDAIKSAWGGNVSVSGDEISVN